MFSLVTCISTRVCLQLGIDILKSKNLTLTWQNCKIILEMPMGTHNYIPQMKLYDMLADT